MDERPDNFDICFSVDLSLLVPLLRLIDHQIEEIEVRYAHNPSDGDTFGWFDDEEALAGLGFVACQQLLNATYRPAKPLRATEPSRKSGAIADERRKLRDGAMCKGPLHPCGVPYARAIDAAANFWKHQGEWVAGEETKQERERR
jgi:hypothetical protein